MSENNRKANLQAVMDAADKIHSSGEKVTQRRLRNELGGGSWSDIRDGWHKWTSSRNTDSSIVGEEIEEYGFKAWNEISNLRTEIFELTSDLEHERFVRDIFEQGYKKEIELLSKQIGGLEKQIDNQWKIIELMQELGMSREEALAASLEDKKTNLEEK